MPRKSTKRTKKRKACVLRENGRSYELLDSHKEDIPAHIWAAIERFEDDRLGIARAHEVDEAQEALHDEQERAAARSRAFDEEFCPESEDDDGSQNEIQDNAIENAAQDKKPSPSVEAIAIEAISTNECEDSTAKAEKSNDTLVEDTRNWAPNNQEDNSAIESTQIGENAHAIEREESLIQADAVQVLMSLSPECPTLAKWLQQEPSKSAPLQTLEGVFDEETLPIQSSLMDLQPCINAWPANLQQRSLYVPSNASAAASPLVVYWIQHTWRMHHNYALQAAKLLSDQLQAPVLAFCSVPKHLISSQTIKASTDQRHSIADMRRQLQSHYIPLYGVVESADECMETREVRMMEVLNSFHAQVIITDDSIVNHPYKLQCYRQKLDSNVLLVDSSCVVPWRILHKLQSNVPHIWPKVEFKAQWSKYLDNYLRTMNPFEFDTERQSLVFPSSSSSTFAVHTIAWELLDRPLDIAFDLSESNAIAHVQKVIQSSSSLQPAIQAELQGSGVLSLLPFIRHGSLSPIYLLQSLAVMPSKVLYTRALEYCGYGREYVMYLQSHLELKQPDSTPIDSLILYKDYITSTALFPQDRIVFASQMTYLPYHLEASATNDAFWNDIQTHLRITGYIHPILTIHWVHRLLEWSPSLSAALQMIEALLFHHAIATTTTDVLELLQHYLQHHKHSTSITVQESLRQQLQSLPTIPPP